jgi:transcription initiation factor TFIIIB Brf1 subunit/transcription initiation factor TFIIB
MSDFSCFDTNTDNFNFSLFNSALDEYNKTQKSENSSLSSYSRNITKRKVKVSSNEAEYDMINNDDLIKTPPKKLIIVNTNTSEQENEEKKDNYFEKLRYNNNFDAENNLSLCKHLNVIEENGMICCSDCGRQMDKSVFSEKEWRYYGQSDNKRNSDPNRVHLRKQEERNIFKDVENMGFSDKIVSLANELYLQVTNGKIYRGNSRKGIIFACIFHSFKIHNKPQPQDKLIKLFDLSRKSGLKGIKFVHLHSPNDSAIHTTYITPIHLVDDIMDKFNASDKQKQEVIQIYEQIKNKSSKINRSRPLSVSAGLIYFWICIKGIDISLKDFASKIELSELTVSKITEEIAKILKVPLLI